MRQEGIHRVGEKRRNNTFAGCGLLKTFSFQEAACLFLRILCI